MGVTLEQLLDSSGITSLRGDVEKTASENAQPSPEDLVTALRKQAEVVEDQQLDVKVAAAKELAEKTAEILVIQKTIEEIDKVASLNIDVTGQKKLAAFIKTAIDKGHSQREIAEFLKQSGWVGRKLKEVAQTLRRPGIRRATGKVERGTESEIRLLREKMLEGSQKEVSQHLNTLESQYGRPAVVKRLQQLKEEGTPLPGAAYRLLPKQPGGGKTYKVKLPGGGEHEVSADTAHKVMLGGGALGTGLLVGGRKSGEGKGGKGVVVVK